MMAQPEVEAPENPYTDWQDVYLEEKRRGPPHLPDPVAPTTHYTAD
jgi:hypothetical protein